MVMDATRFPKRAASTADPVIASAMAAPAEKLSPAPHTSTGSSTARGGTRTAEVSSTTSTPCGPFVTNINFERVLSAQALVIDISKQPDRGRVSFLLVGFQDHILEALHAHSGIHPDDFFGIGARDSRAAHREPPESPLRRCLVSA